MTTKTKTKITVDELFGEGYTGNLLKGKYHTDKVYAWFQKRHSRGHNLIDEDGYWVRNGYRWKVPYGVRDALKQQLTFSQIATKYPFFATWVSPKTGRRLRKSFMSLPAAIDFVASKAQRVDPDASVVARHGFYIPTKLMGKFPRRSTSGKMYYWCPRCMEPRLFRRRNEDYFFIMKKVWSEEKQRYVWVERKLAVLHCTVCGISNRDHKFRASNQPVEKVRIKKGKRRVRRRR